MHGELKRDKTLREGRSLFHKGDYQAARDAFQDCLELDPDNVAALTGLGLSQSRLGKHERAVETFEEVSRLRPRSPAVQFARGLTLHRAGKKVASTTAFELVLDAQPEHESAIAWLNRLKPAAPPSRRKARDDDAFDEDARTERADAVAEEAAEEAIEAAAEEAEAVEAEVEADVEEALAEEAVEAEAEAESAEAADTSTEFDVDEAIAEAEAEAEEAGEAEAEPPLSKAKPKPKRKVRDEEEDSEPAEEAGPLRWPHFGVNPLEKDDGWGGMKVVKCERGLLKIKGARNVTFQKQAPNVVEPGFLGFGGKKLSTKEWTLVRFVFKKADKKNPEKGVIECVDGEGKTRFSIPGGKTVDGKAVFGLRAAVHLARMFKLDLEIEGEPMNGDEELKAAVEALQ